MLGQVLGTCHMTSEAKEHMVNVSSMGIDTMDVKLGDTDHLEVIIDLKWF